VHVDFHLLVYSTAGNIVLDEYGHSWPSIVLTDQFKCFQVSGVSSGKGVVVASGDISSEVSISGYKASVFKKRVGHLQDASLLVLK